MKFNLATFSDEALKAIAQGTNATMAKLACEILAKRKCPVRTSSPETRKQK